MIGASLREGGSIGAGLLFLESLPFDMRLLDGGAGSMTTRDAYGRGVSDPSADACTDGLLDISSIGLILSPIGDVAGRLELGAS